MNLFQSIILGIVQGFTEFLPISSTAHLRIVPALFHWKDPGTAFSAVLQLGTMFSVIIYFWKDLIKIYGAFINDLLTNKKLTSYDSKLGFWIILGTIPICIFGFLFKEPIEAGLARSLNTVSFYLIFFGLLLYISEIFSKETRTIGNINPLDVLLIGIAQSFALIPGVSRSGVTIFAVLLLGFKRSHAAKFSFLLSVPAILASGVLELSTLISVLNTGASEIIWQELVIGVIFACLSGFMAIDFLLKYLQSHKTHIFVIYRVILGILVLYLNFRGL